MRVIITGVQSDELPESRFRLSTSAGKVSITVRQDVSSGEINALQTAIEEFTGRPEHVAVPSGVTYTYFGIVTTNVAADNISSAKVEFRVLRSWLEQNDVNEDTIKLLRWSGSEWQELLTSFLSSDPDYLYFDASMEGLSLFAATGQGRAVPPPPVVPTSPMPVFYALMALFGAMGGVAYAYVRWSRPISPRISLKRLKVSRPVVSIKHLRKVVTPAISIKSLTPAPMTLALALPVGPRKPVPIVTLPPAPPPRRVMPKAMVPSEILERLKRGPRPPAQRVAKPVKPGVPLEGLKQIAKPMEQGVLLEDLTRLAKPTERAITLEGLRWVGKQPVEPGIPMKRLEQLAKPLEPSISLKRLKDMARSSPKSKAPPGRGPAARGAEPESILERLKREEL